MNKTVHNSIRQLFATQTPSTKSNVITAADLETVPEPVRRYLTYTNIVGKPRILTARLKQDGALRTAPERGWVSMQAEEYYTVDPPGFVWYGDGKMMPLVHVTAHDMLLNGHGRMRIRLLSLIKLGDVSGPEMNQGALLRYLNEMIWFPSAWLESYVSWEAIDDERARVSMTLGDTTVSAECHFNEIGQLTNFIADRYRSVGDSFELTRWSTPIYEYAEFNGIRVPVQGDAVWHLPDGEFSYFRVTVTALEYGTITPFN